MFRVLIDATAVPPNRGGVGRYVDELIPALARTDVELRVVCQRHDVDHYGRLSGTDPIAISAAARRPPLRLAWEQVRLPAVVRRVGPHVVHCPHYTHPLASRVPAVVTVHDATFFTHPQLHSPVKARFFRTATRLAVRRAAGLVVPSAATRDELDRLVRVRPDRVTVAPHGVDHETFREPTDAEVAELRRSLDLGHRPFVSFLGTVEPRKNVPNLIRGWAAAVSARPEPPALVIAGARGWDTEVDAAIASLPPGLVVRRPGYLPVEQLPALLGGATVMAYPSLGEGFGLPVAEAMACGAAVLTTRRLSLPEVGGDAVAYTEPDAAAIAGALGELLDDPERRDKLRAAARNRAAGFTWDRCAQLHVEAYRKAAGR